MASTRVKRGKNGSAGRPPLSQHRAFPLIVGLWFAALLGVGTLILPTIVFERLVVASGLPSLWPATQPPLGFTARSTIAVSSALLGALLGALIAFQIARAQRPEAPQRAIRPADFLKRQPINAHEDLGADGFDAPVARPVKRRSLALAADLEQAPSDYLAPRFADEAVAAAPADDGADEQAPEPLMAAEPGEETEPGMEDTDEALDLADLSEFTDTEDFAVQSATDDTALEEDEVPMDDHRSFTPADAMNELTGGAKSAPAEESGPEEIDPPLNFSPPSMARFDDDAERPPSFAAPEEDAGEQDETDTAPIAAEPAAVSRDVCGDSELDALVDRLSAAIAKRRALQDELARARIADVEARAEPPAPQASEPQALGTPAPRVPGGFEMADPNEASQAMAAYFGKPAADDADEAPEILDRATQEADEPDTADLAARSPLATKPQAPFMQRLSGVAAINEPEEDEDEAIADLAASFSLPLQRATARPAPEAENEPVELDGEDDAPEADDAEGASLLAMRNPFREKRPEYVRIDEPEPEGPEAAVVFPHEEPRSAASRAFDPPGGTPANIGDARPAPKSSNDDNERALREALVNLQRMGKAS